MSILSTTNTVSSDVDPRRINTELGPINVRRCESGQPSRRELVTITVTKEDYEKLKVVVGPLQKHVDRALLNYLKAIQQTSRRSQVDDLGWQRGPMMSFLCAIPKNVSEQIRRLSGRFDTHTIQAFRIFLL